MPLAAIAPGAPFTPLGRRLLFPAFDRRRPGWGLWSTDGTPAGTRLVRDICLGACRSQPPDAFASVQGRVVFTADDGAHGAELWLTDGTPTGTRLLADVCPGACSSVDAHLTRHAVHLGNRLFLALADRRGLELWSTDGTPAGTRQVKDLCAGACGSRPMPFAAVQGRVVFTANDGVHGLEVWASDGTALGTVRLTDFAPDHPFADFDFFDAAALPGAVLFSAPDDEHGTELWRSDGTAAGTGLLADLASRDIGGSFPCGLGAANGRLWFTAADDRGPRDHQIWTSDGTAEGTRAVFELRDLPWIPIYPCPQYPAAAAAGGKTLFLFGQDPFHPTLWATDGTAAGTAELTHDGPSSDLPGLFSVGSNVLFFDGASELWRSNGTAAGTLPVAQPGFVSEATTFNGRLFFNADGELWATDGTAAGTALVVDPDPDSRTNPTGLAVFGGRLYFFADLGPALRTQLWSSDGTAAGTHLALDLAGDLPPIVAADRMYFFAAAPGDPRGLWVSDGTSAGTRFLMETGEGGPAIAVGSRLFFLGSGGALWTSDGTEGGTRPLLDRDGGPVLNVGSLRSFAGRLVFTTFVGGEGTLWQSDGTDAGTFTIRSQVRPGVNLQEAGNRLYFSAYDPQHGTELWALAPE